MKNWFSKLSPTLQIVLVIGAIIVIYLLFKGGKNFFKVMGQNAQQAGEEAAYLAQGIKKTYLDSQYKQFAQRLETAMIGVGTDENSIFSVFKSMKNDLDVLALESAFGIRSGRWQITGYDLGTWLTDELSSSDIQKLNSILTNNGINRQY